MTEKKGELPEDLKYYWHRMDRNLQTEIDHLVEQCGKKQFFNALRSVGRIVTLITCNLQILINDDNH